MDDRQHTALLKEISLMASAPHTALVSIRSAGAVRGQASELTDLNRTTVWAAVCSVSSCMYVYSGVSPYSKGSRSRLVIELLDGGDLFQVIVCLRPAYVAFCLLHGVCYLSFIFQH